ncbi:rCG54840 [Rattus norvegicus]|uniref:RCG54840 n=1 Tax=Rattus norvegicus TaxID=10116 RepID=A6IIC3_RAT|nr:rCG54840 [Rattus norvegicus]
MYQRGQSVFENFGGSHGGGFGGNDNYGHGSFVGSHSDNRKDSSRIDYHRFGNDESNFENNGIVNLFGNYNN